MIWQIDTNCSWFKLLNMLPFHIMFRILEANLLGLISNFSKYYFKTGTICLLFLSSHVFTTLEFGSNHFNILLWKIVKLWTIMKLNHQSEKYPKNINQSDIILWCHKNNCYAHLLTKFMTLISRYPTSKGIKNAINLESTFQKKDKFP